jgi:hypothetical protein
MESVEDKIAKQAPVSGFFNHYENRVINDYLSEKNISAQTVWQEIKNGIDTGAFHYFPPSQPITRFVDTVVSSQDKICDLCSQLYFKNGPLYQWRKNIDPAELPNDVTSRSPCWYGRECRTQFNLANPTHAERLNHICENTRRT